MQALELPAGRPVRVWVLDEMRAGLHSFTRKVWVVGSQRPVAPSQQRYQWGYIYGAVGIGHGRSEFAFVSSVDQELMLEYYQQLSASDPYATHVLIQDGAGFHLRDGDARLPQNVRIIQLPPYCPELSPQEKVWDQIRDVLCNRAFETMDELYEVAEAWIQDFWANQRRAFSVVGSGWLLLKVNSFYGGIIP